jgi:hypothetical protein
VSAADINDPPVAGEVVSCRDGGAFVAAGTGHHIVEDLRSCWLLGKVVKERFAIDMIEGGFAGSDAVGQVAPGAPVGLAAAPQCLRTNALWGVWRNGSASGVSENRLPPSSRNSPRLASAQDTVKRLSISPSGRR